MAEHPAWKFAYPLIDGPRPEAGIRLSKSGRLAKISETGRVRQAILLLLSTRPGERIMRPDYGCDLHRLVFWPNDETTAGLAIHYVRTALERWIPEVEILHLDAGPNASDLRGLAIELEYRLKNQAHSDQLGFSLSLEGEEP